MSILREIKHMGEVSYAVVFIHVIKSRLFFTLNTLTMKTCEDSLEIWTKIIAVTSQSWKRSLAFHLMLKHLETIWIYLFLPAMGK